MESHLSRFRIKPSSSTSTTPESSGSGLTHQEPDASPIPGRVTACDRCRRLKKKCSRTVPECEYCANAGVECSLGAFTPANMARLRARLAWVESFIDQRNLLGGGRLISQLMTGTDLSELADRGEGLSPGRANELLVPGSADTRSVLPPSGSKQPSEGESASPRNEDDARRSLKRLRLGHTGTSSVDDPDEYESPAQQPLPEKSIAHALVDAYFQDVNRAYPFLNRNMIFLALKNIGDRVPSLEERNVDSTILYLVMAIGKTTLQRAGRVPPNDDTVFEVKYTEIISSCRAQEGIDSVQILLLLALYCITDPHGVPVSPLIELTARQAIRLGLAQRVPPNTHITGVEIERNHRLFWSIFVMDRMVAVTLGMPPALEVSNVNVPLPGLTVDEFASPERMEYTSTLQVARHIIHLRQIEDKIFTRVHLRGGTLPSTNTERMALITDLRTEIENWYSNGCLLKSSEPGDMTIHITIAWVAARYYNLLLLLYYPSQSNLIATALSRGELLSITQKHMRANAARFEHRQLPLTNITLYRLFPVCLIFLYCFVHHRSEDGPFSAGEEIAVCADILSAYPDAWSQAHRAAAVMGQFVSLVSSSPGNRPASSYPANQARTLGQADRVWCHAIKSTLVELMQETFGSSSALQFSEMWGEANHASPNEDYQRQASAPASSSARAFQTVPLMRPTPGEGGTRAGDRVTLNTPHGEGSDLYSGSSSFLDLI